MRFLASLSLAVLLLPGCSKPSQPAQPAQPAQPSRPAETADLVLWNGKVMTASGDSASALAIGGEGIVAVGSDEEVLALAGSDTDRVDLAGRRVIPGLGENHWHALGGGPGVDLAGARSLDEVLAAVRTRAAETPPDGLVVSNSNWHEGQLREQRLPLRDDLDRAAPKHAVVLVRGGHEYILNSRALERWGIREGVGDPPGGRLGRYPDGRLNGELVDRAKDPVKLPPRPRLDSATAMRRLAEEHAKLLSMGVTSVRYAGGTVEEYRLLERLRQDGRLALRVSFLFRLTPGHDPASLGELFAEWNVTPEEGDDWLRVGGIKLGVDGGFEGGLMRDPYAEPWGQGGRYRGLQTFPTERYTELVQALHRLGWRVATHAVGDRAIDLVLDAYEAAHAHSPIDARRWVIEHGFLPRPDHFPRMRALGVGVTAQNHLYLAAPSLVSYWGQERAEWVTPARAYLDAGIPLSSGTDSPVVPWNPFWSLYHFITRDTLSAGVMGAAQAVTRREALNMSSFGNAWLDFHEDRRGALAVGQLADLVVLSRDILTCPEEKIPDIEAVLTLVGGQIRHDGRNDTTVP